MALTVTKVFHTVVGDRYMHVYDVTGDASQTGTGESLTKAQLGFAATADPEFHVIVSNPGGYVADYDITNALLIVYRQSGVDNAALEQADTANLSAVTFRVTAFGHYPQ